VSRGAAFGFIAAEKTHFGVRRLCRVLGVSKTAFCDWAARGGGPSAAELEAAHAIHAAREAWVEHRRVYGARRLTAEIRSRGDRWNRNRVARLMPVGVSRACIGAGVASTVGAPPPPRPPRTWSSGTSPRPRPTRCGSPTSPTCAPGRASSTWRWSSMPARARSWVGRWPTTDLDAVGRGGLRLALGDQSPGERAHPAQPRADGRGSSSHAQRACRVSSSSTRSRPVSQREE
jgi:hypothetical protein